MNETSSPLFRIGPDVRPVFRSASDQLAAASDWVTWTMKLSDWGAAAAAAAAAAAFSVRENKIHWGFLYYVSSDNHAWTMNV